ncbi:MAG: PilZ domain-containing protein [Acidobacteriota bacterium]|nr:PilZ domain-containing protein [Acidobacteriota bacterium]
MSTVSPVAEKRQTGRASISLSSVVKGRESKDSFWKEVTEVTSVSATGAGFQLRRECRAGQLLSLMIPMPPRLRCYDYEKQLYRVWGLVQHCSPISSVSGENSGGGSADYYVGVAFIGKDAPPDYFENPSQSYRLSGIGEDGLWKIARAERAFVNRRHARFWTSIDVSIGVLDPRQEMVIQDEKTRTENISLSGAAVYSNLEVNVGDFVKFTSDTYNFDALAVVRNRRARPDEPSKLHLEFVDANFPVEGIAVN